MDSTNNRNPVLLVHGIIRTSAVFRRMSSYLLQTGWSVHSFNLTPNDASLGLDQLAIQVADYVDKTFAPQQPIDLIGLSMGGSGIEKMPLTLLKSGLALVKLTPMFGDTLLRTAARWH